MSEPTANPHVDLNNARNLARFSPKATAERLVALESENAALRKEIIRLEGLLSGQVERLKGPEVIAR